MLDGTPPALLYEWMEYFHLEPFGEEREDIRSAQVCLTIAQAMGMKKRGGGTFALKDFMIRFDEPDKSTYTPEQAKNILKQRYGNNSKSRS